MRKETINVAVYSTHGNPADVLRIESQPWPRPGADEVVVEMQAAPINPADLNAIEGKYPGKREVPAVPGFEGSGIVSELGENVSNDMRNTTGGTPIQLGLNAVGGESALRLMTCLAASGTLVTFGAMSLQPLKIPNGLLIFKDLRFRGIWINKWYDNATPAERMAAFNPIFEMAGRGWLQTKVEKSYPLNEIKAAVEHAAHAQRRGKIIFEFGTR